MDVEETVDTQVSEKCRRCGSNINRDRESCASCGMPYSSAHSWPLAVSSLVDTEQDNVANGSFLGGMLLASGIFMMGACLMALVSNFVENFGFPEVIELPVVIVTLVAAQIYVFIHTRHQRNKTFTGYIAGLLLIWPIAIIWILAYIVQHYYLRRII